MGKKQVKQRNTKDKRLLILMISLLSGVAIFVTVLGVILFSNMGTSNSQSKSKGNKLRVDGEVSYSSDYDDSHLVMDEATGIGYLDNEVIVQFAEDIDENDAKKLANSFEHSQQVGFISVTDTAQWRLRNTYSEEEMTTLCNKIQEDPSVEYAYVNSVIKTDVNAAKTEESKEWNEDEKRWGYDDIHADSVFDYEDEMKDSINIGILDAGFLRSNDVDYYTGGTGSRKDNHNLKHGTHVAGIIAATHNNKKGIAGVYPNFNESTKLMAYRILRYDKKEKEVVGAVSDYQIKDHISQMLLSKCKVINYSMGYPDGSVYALQENYRNMGEEGTLVKKFRESILHWSDYLKRWIIHDYHFLLINAAGNSSNHSEGLGTPNDLYQNGFDGEAALYNDNCLGEKVQGEYVLGPEFSSDFLMINDPVVKSRIICVSAYGTDKKITDFSNMGDRTDILAPGYQVLSTVGGNEVERFSGTSMAAPMVTGAAASIWSLDSTLTADEVRDILLQEIDGNTAVNTITDADCGVTKPVLDLRESLKLGVEYLSHREQPVSDSDDYQVRILVGDAAYEQTYPPTFSIFGKESNLDKINQEDILPIIVDYQSEAMIEDARVTITDEYGNTLYDSEKAYIPELRHVKDPSNFVNPFSEVDLSTFPLPEGSYTVTVKADGYRTAVFENMHVPENSTRWDSILSYLKFKDTVWEFYLEKETIDDQEDASTEAPWEAPTEATTEDSTEEETWTSDYAGTYLGYNGPAGAYAGPYNFSDIEDTTTAYSVHVYSQNGNELELDVTWANMRVIAESERETVTLNGNSARFTTHVVGGHGIDDDFTFTIEFGWDHNTATLYCTDEDMPDRVPLLKE